MVLFNAKLDMYGCVTAKSDAVSELMNEDFRTSLEESLLHWKEKKVRGIWFHISIQHSRFIPLLVAKGFTFHHAQKDYVMMTRWLPEGEECTLPKYPHMFIGCGGLVIDEQDRVLLMREKKGHYLGWKFPGGLAEPNETIMETARREVREETGVDADGDTVLSFRQVSAGQWRDTNDIYFLCILRPRDEKNIQVTADSVETAEARWMSRAEIAALPAKQFAPLLKSALDMYDQWKASGRKGLHMSTAFSAYRSLDFHTFSVD